MNDKTKSILAGLLFLLFGCSSWVDIEGLWVELPILVNKLPEKWFLPAYFVVIIQLANIGPLIYGLSYRFTTLDKHKVMTGFIYGIMTVGMVSTLTLAFVWDQTSFIGGNEHSTATLILTFFLAFVDTTSSVTFIPFMYQYEPHHMTAFFIGSGLSGLIPTALAFVQGSGEYSCENVTSAVINETNTWNVKPQYVPLQFSVQTFFLLLFGVFVISLGAFILLECSHIGKSQRKSSQTDPSLNSEVARENKEQEGNTAETTIGENNLSSTEQKNITKNEVQSRLTKGELVYLLLVIAVTNGLAFGALPSVQSFSLLPYGHIYYSVGVKLAAAANPLACFITFFAVAKRISVISILSAIALICAGYILAISHYSPHPPYNNTVSAVIMVLVWILFVGLVSYVKVIISAKLLPEGHNALFWSGVSSQIGSLVGSLLSFLCVNYYPGLTPAYPCIAY